MAHSKVKTYHGYGKSKLKKWHSIKKKMALSFYKVWQLTLKMALFEKVYGTFD